MVVFQTMLVITPDGCVPDHAITPDGCVPDYAGRGHSDQRYNLWAAHARQVHRARNGLEIKRIYIC